MVKNLLNRKEIQCENLCFCKKIANIEMRELICQEFYLKGWKLEVEIIIIQKQPPSVFHGKAIEKAETSLATLTSENYQ